METAEKEPLVAVSYRVRPKLRAWIAVESSQKHDRSANWLVNKILEEAYAKAKQPQGAQQ